jgi:hypothetical protein
VAESLVARPPKGLEAPAKTSLPSESLRRSKYKQRFTLCQVFLKSWKCYENRLGIRKQVSRSIAGPSTFLNGEVRLVRLLKTLVRACLGEAFIGSVACQRQASAVLAVYLARSAQRFCASLESICVAIDFNGDMHDSRPITWCASSIYSPKTLYTGVCLPRGAQSLADHVLS